MACLLAAGGTQWAVPFQDANRARVAKRATSATSPRMRAAPAGPMPNRPIRPVPVAATALRSVLLSLIFLTISLDFSTGIPD